MNKIKHYHFIGIGGISMSAIAKLVYKQNNIVTGSDINLETKLDFCDVNLKNWKTPIKNADIVVYSYAISNNNKELVYAKQLNKTILSRTELLNNIAKEYKNVIAVSGMHGKTTTTELIAECLIEAGLFPTVHLGGISKMFNSNLLIGNKTFFVTEACEYKDSFLKLHPTISVILNIEKEHLDYFKNIDNIKNSFTTFARQSQQVISKAKYNFDNCETFGDNGLWQAKNIVFNKKIFAYEYDVYKNGQFYDHFTLNTIIEKNIENSLACLVVCEKLNIPIKYIQNTFKNFCGVKRRLEKINSNPIIIHDYAHHPSEINSVIESVKKNYNKKIIIAFQPHTFSRTKIFFQEFKKVLNKADILFLLKTFPAREKEKQGKSAHNLYEAIKKIKKQTYYYEDILPLSKAIKKLLTKDYLLLILGAGDIYKLNNYFNNKYF